MVDGFIFDIQRFSTKDGPGIRTTVFLKGCNLRCQWCHNPESIRPWQELQYFKQRCTNCGACAELCPCHRIVDGEHVLDRSICNLCGRCESVCYYDALRMAGKTMSASDVMKIVAQDHDYYEHSGGGLTISGGEPLEQVDFACDLLKMARQNGIHTAIDTAGNVPFDRFEKILPYANLILFDIKSLDSKQHQFYTGSANNRITDNIQRLLQIEFPIMIRVPVIPGVNDNDSFNSQLQTLIKDKKSILKVEYLPYHDLGKVKAASLN